MRAMRWLGAIALALLTWPAWAGSPQIIFQNGTNLYQWTMNNTSISSQGALPSPGAGWSVLAAGDMDGDGTPDLWLQNGTSVYVWGIGSNGQAIWEHLYDNAAGTFRIFGAADYSGNGYGDVYLYDPGRQIVATPLLTSSLAGVFSSPTVKAVLGIAPTPHAVGDINGDGHPDIILEDSIGNTWAYEMNGTTIAAQCGLPGAPGYATSDVWQLVGAADFDGDGNADLVWQDPQNLANMRVWYMSGCSRKSVATLPSPNPGQVAMTVGVSTTPSPGTTSYTSYPTLLVPNEFLANWVCDDGSMPQVLNSGGPGGQTIIAYQGASNANNWTGLCGNGAAPHAADVGTTLQYRMQGFNYDSIREEPLSGTAIASNSIRYQASPAANGAKPWVTFGGSADGGGWRSVANPSYDWADNIGYVFNLSSPSFWGSYGGGSGEQIMAFATYYPVQNPGYYLGYFGGVNCPNESLWGNYPLSWDTMTFGSPISVNLSPSTTFPQGTLGTTVAADGTTMLGVCNGSPAEFWHGFAYMGWEWTTQRLQTGGQTGSVSVSMPTLYTIEIEGCQALQSSSHCHAPTDTTTATQAEVLVFDRMLGYRRFEAWCSAHYQSDPHTGNIGLFCDSSVCVDSSCSNNPKPRDVPPFTAFDNRLCPQITGSTYLDQPQNWVSPANGSAWYLETCQDYKTVTPASTYGLSNWTASTFFGGFPNNTCTTAGCQPRAMDGNGTPTPEPAFPGFAPTTPVGVSVE